MSKKRGPKDFRIGEDPWKAEKFVSTKLPFPYPFPKPLPEFKDFIELPKFKPEIFDIDREFRPIHLKILELFECIIIAEIGEYHPWYCDDDPACGPDGYDPWHRQFTTHKYRGQINWVGGAYRVSLHHLAFKRWHWLGADEYGQPYENRIYRRVCDLAVLRFSGTNNEILRPYSDIYDSIKPSEYPAGHPLKALKDYKFVKVTEFRGSDYQGYDVGTVLAARQYFGTDTSLEFAGVYSNVNFDDSYFLVQVYGYDDNDQCKIVDYGEFKVHLDLCPPDKASCPVGVGVPPFF